MQVLYMLDSQVQSSPTTLLHKEFDKTRNLFVFLVHLMHQIAQYAEIEAKHRASKNLPNQADLSVNIKLAGNQILWQTLAAENFKKALDLVKPAQWIDPNMVKSIYRQMVASDEYQVYISEEGRDKAKEKNILKFIFGNLILNTPNVIEYIEELFPNWDDDGEMMIGFMMNYFDKPNKVDFIDLIGQEKTKFAVDLINTALEKKSVTEAIIKPKLTNWDPERIAMIDMLLLRLGVVELLYFDTIPTKVTINEYIDLAKEYSTEQSGHFVNGILDNIHKELIDKGEIQKISHKST